MSVKEKKKGSATVPSKVKATVKKKGVAKAVNTIAVSAVPVEPVVTVATPAQGKKMTIKSDYLKFEVDVPTKIVADDPKYIPQYQTAGAACADVLARITKDEPGAFLDKDENGVEKWSVQLPSRAVRLVDSGFKMQLPEGWKAECTVRSGHAKRGIVVCNAPGQIDEDYRGPIKVIVGNVGKEVFTIRDGDRIAQIFPVPTFRFAWDKVDVLDASERGEGGFGSTGVSEAPPKPLQDKPLHQNYYDVRKAG